MENIIKMVKDAHLIVLSIMRYYSVTDTNESISKYMGTKGS